MPSSMQWFKLYSEARNDAKLRTLTDAQHRVWFNLLCLAAEQVDRGSVLVEDEELFAIEVASGDTALLHETVQRLLKLRILVQDGEALTFVHFAERQQERPSASKDAVRERVRRHREKKRNAGEGVTRVTGVTCNKCGVTHEGDCNGRSVTAGVTSSDDLSSETGDNAGDVTDVTRVTPRVEKKREELYISTTGGDSLGTNPPTPTEAMPPVVEAIGQTPTVLLSENGTALRGPWVEKARCWCFYQPGSTPLSRAELFPLTATWTDLEPLEIALSEYAALLPGVDFATLMQDLFITGDYRATFAGARYKFAAMLSAIGKEIKFLRRQLAKGAGQGGKHPQQRGGREQSHGKRRTDLDQFDN